MRGSVVPLMPRANITGPACDAPRPTPAGHAPLARSPSSAQPPRPKPKKIPRPQGTGDEK